MSDDQPVPSETDEVVAFLAGKADGDSRNRLARRAGESGDDIATAVDWLVSRSQSLARVTIGDGEASHDSNVGQGVQEETLPADSPSASLDVRDAAAVEGRAAAATGSPGTEILRTSWRRSWPLPAAALVLAIAVIAGFALRSTAPSRGEPFEVWPQSVATRGHDGGAVPTIGSDGEFRIHGREMSLVIRSPIDGVATILMVSDDRVQVVPNPNQPQIDVQAEVARSYSPLAAPTSRSVVVVVVAPRRVDDELRDLKPAAPQGASVKKSVSAQVRERLVRGGIARFELTSIELAPAERAGAAETLDEVVDERFVEESSYSSRVAGPVRKTSGVLFLSGGSSVELPVRAGLNVDVDLAFTSAGAGAERPSVTQIGLRTENGSDYAVAMLLANSEAASECQLFFLDLSPGPDGKPDPTMLAGRFSVPIENLDGTWSLRWRFGHVELWRGTARVALQYFHALAHPITSVRVAQVRGTVGLGRLRIAASPAPDPWRPEERSQWQLAEAAESRLHQHWAQGRSKEARTEGEEVLRLRAAVAGIEHPDVALAHLNLATLLFRMGDYRESRDSAEAALGSFKKRLGSGHPLTSLAHERVGEACRELGDLAAAEPHFSESLHWRLRALGAAHPQVADSHTNIGQLALAKGDTSRARSEFERSWEIRRESAGEESPSAAHGLNDLGMVLLMQGDFVAATEMLTSALAIRQRTLPKDHYEISLSLNNLALARRESGELALARELWEEAVCRLESAFPLNHPWMLSLAENLAVADAQHGAWLSAQKRFESAAALSRERYGDCGRTARLRFHLARALDSLGESGRAREEWQAAEAWAEKAVSSNDRLALHILFDRGLRLKCDGDAAAAREVFRGLLERHVRLSLGTLATLSEAEMFAFVTLTNRRRDQYLWILRSQREQNAADAYAAVWQTKSVATRMLGARKLFQRQSVEARSILDELRDLKTRLSRATHETEGELTQESRLALLADLGRRKEAAERRLASAVVAPEFLVDANQLPFQELMARLPDDMAVVDFVNVQDWSTPVQRGQAAESRSVYEAFVLTNKSGKRELEWIHLGPAAQIDEAIERWRSLLVEPESAVGERDGVATRELATSGAVVRELLWAPLERSLGTARTVIVIPDGRVAGLPWAGLPGGKPDSFLVDQFAIGVALNARHLLESARLKTAAEVQGLLAVGISDFRSSEREGNAVEERTDAARREMTRTARNRGWPPLEGAARQVKAIEREAPIAVDALVDSTATKSSVMAKLATNRYALIATHGFFEPAGGPVQRRPTDSRFRSGANEVANEAWDIPSVIGERNPLLSCGLVFAGGEIATGEELSELDMRGVEQVLLMACDTGVGAVKDGEGAQSLQRSLALAGARNVVASLWKVDDSAAEDFTRRYLRNVVDGTRSPLHSLRDAQLAQRRGQGPGISDRPRYWATWTINVDGSVFDPPSPSRMRLIAPAIALLMFASVLFAAYRLSRKLSNVSVTRGDPG